MPLFLVIRSQDGPAWDAAQPLEGQSGWREHAEFMDALVAAGFVVLGGPLPNRRVALAVDAASEEELHARLAADPWTGSHLRTESVEPWTIRLDGRRSRPLRASAPASGRPPARSG